MTALSRTKTIVATAIITALIVGGVAYAVTIVPPASTDKVYACVSTAGEVRSGKIRYNSAPTSCPNVNDVVRYWNAQGPKGDPGQSATSTYTVNGTFTAPPGVTKVIVEAFGGGGGGSGGPSTGDETHCGAEIYGTSGQSGGHGAYVRAEVPVTAGQSYAIVIGTGGPGGAGGAAGTNCPANDSSPGSNGGDTTFATLVTAGGGDGGPCAVGAGGAPTSPCATAEQAQPGAVTLDPAVKAIEIVGGGVPGSPGLGATVAGATGAAGTHGYMLVTVAT